VELFGREKEWKKYTLTKPEQTKQPTRKLQKNRYSNPSRTRKDRRGSSDSESTGYVKIYMNVGNRLTRIGDHDRADQLSFSPEATRRCVKIENLHVT
jgi:hypothetical protein